MTIVAALGAEQCRDPAADDDFPNFSLNFRRRARPTRGYDTYNIYISYVIVCMYVRDGTY